MEKVSLIGNCVSKKKDQAKGSRVGCELLRTGSGALGVGGQVQSEPREVPALDPWWGGRLRLGSGTAVS